MNTPKTATGWMRWLKRTRARAAFTLAEVALALAVVAFGLVAVLGVLPVGLNVQRDNREDTLIKNDGEYWMNAIRGGRLALDSLNHVEWVELEANGATYRAEFAALQFDGAPDDPALWPVFNGNSMPPITYRGSLKQATWRGDVIGWLSTPDVVAGRKRAKIRPMGGTLLHRKYGEKTVGQDGKVMYRLNGGEQTFSYLLESQIRELAPSFWEIKLAMRWPILEEGPTADTVKTGPGIRTFVTYIHAPLEKAQARWGFGGDERAVFDALIPGTPLAVGQITQFLIDTRVATENRQQWTDTGVLAVLNGLSQKMAAGRDTSGNWLPDVLYDSFGMYSLRSPPGYSPVGDAAGNFVGFDSRPPDKYFREMYFFRPPFE